MGLGSTTVVSLAEARELATAARKAVAGGEDPIAAKRVRAPEPVQVPTFSEFAEAYISSVEDGWKNAVVQQLWRQTVRDYAGPISRLPIDAIGTDDVLAVLQPIWLKIPHSAMRLRGRIEKILDAAKAKGLRPRDAMNPAAWRGHLALLLPKQPKMTRGHHPALPYADIPAFWDQLSSRVALAARCLQFVILTAARSGEALGATWGEINCEAKLWTVPPHRMKAGVEHVVPLSDAAIELLKVLRPERPDASDRIFAINGAARSNMAMAMLLKRMDRADITVHGFRSTFRDWAGDMTQFPREIVEQALAHRVGNETELAYRRGSAVARRRELMAAWADYVRGAGASVVTLPLVDVAA